MIKKPIDLNQEDNLGDLAKTETELDMGARVKSVTALTETCSEICVVKLTPKTLLDKMAQLEKRKSKFGHMSKTNYITKLMGDKKHVNE